MTESVEQGLDRVHADLNAVRSFLFRPGQGEPREMLRHLKSAVEQLETWVAPGAGVRPELSDVEEIRAELQAMQPLFDNAYALQTGWAELLRADEPVYYDHRGLEELGPVGSGQPLIG